MRHRRAWSALPSPCAGFTGFEVLSLKGKVENGKVTEYRATLEVTFILE